MIQWVLDELLPFFAILSKLADQIIIALVVFGSSNTNGATDELDVFFFLVDPDQRCRAGLRHRGAGGRTGKSAETAPPPHHGRTDATPFGQTPGHSARGLRSHPQVSKLTRIPFSS